MKLRCCAFDLGCCKGQVDTAGAVEGRVYPRGATQNRLSTPVSHSERVNIMPRQARDKPRGEKC